MTYKTLIFSIEDGVARITINRPAQMNAIDVLTAKELLLAARQCSTDSTVRCVVLTGAGDRAFCAGGDVAGFASDPERVDSLIEEMAVHLHEAISVFARMRAPVVARVNGTVAGAGLGLMAAADLAVASQTAKFTSAYTKIGLTPDGSTTWFMHAPPDRSPPDEGAVPFEPRVVRGRGDGLGIGQSGGCARGTGRDGR